MFLGTFKKLHNNPILLSFWSHYLTRHGTEKKMKTVINAKSSGIIYGSIKTKDMLWSLLSRTLLDQNF